MSPKKDSSKGRKRKKSKDQNVSCEKPHKQQAQKSNDHQYDNVNKQTESISTYDMSSYNGIGNQYTHDQSTMQQNSVQPGQNLQNPNFYSCSPMPAYYPTPTQSPTQLMPPPILHSTFNQGTDVGEKIDALVHKVDFLVKKLSSIDILNDKLSKFEQCMTNLSNNVEKATKRIDEVEKSMEFINSHFESSKAERQEVNLTLTQLKVENEEMGQNLRLLQLNLNDLNERHIDLQTRSMRENLVFWGLPLEENEEVEQTENIITKFMKDEMHMETVIEFHRAHRFGKVAEYIDTEGKLVKTRPIVCRFKNFKDREMVRSAAKELKDTKFGVNEQFPKEINDRRRALWSYYKEAKNQKKRAYFKRDKLFIEGTEFIPPQQPWDMQTGDNGAQSDEENSRQYYMKKGARPKDFPSRGPHNKPSDRYRQRRK